MLQKYPKSKVVYDIRLCWATLKIIEEGGGEPIASRVGHSFIKEKMRETGAAFGGEMTGHYYFKLLYM
jgi:phosphomannomutase